MIFRFAVVGAAALASLGLGAAAPAPPELAFQVTEGQNLNLFIRDGATAAHVLLRSGPDPRILVAFPAGNSGVGLWFAPLAARASWQLERAPVTLTVADHRGRPLHGVGFTVSTDAARLLPVRAVLSNVRFLRDYQAIGKTPSEVATPIAIDGRTLEMHRDRLDGAPGYRLTLEVREGRIADGAILPGPSGRITLAVTAASGDTPLTPLPAIALLNAKAARDQHARDTLRFLSYREKFLAGSWRFNTYFGRDTLMSVRLLMPALQPQAIEAGLSSVLARLAVDGEVAHEEGIGEFAVVEHRRDGTGGDAATLDFGMVDSGYMLAPVAADYLLGRADRVAARRYLALELASESRPGKRERVGTLLVRNLRLVTATARAFAAAPGVTNLVAIKPGRMSGEWRDSDEGLGRGRYPYDVNAVFVPAALEAAARLLAAGLLDPYLGPEARRDLAGATKMAKVWREQAPPLFRVSRQSADARQAIEEYARMLGVPAEPALTALGDAPLDFHALALNADGSPVPIVNSDEGFALLFGAPSAADLDTFVGAVMRPFPAGLMTEIGLLVANPALAGREAQARFTSGAYHGTVVWSWHQALMAAGLERQLKRRDLPEATRSRLLSAQSALWRAIAATRAFGNSELWSWAFKDGHYQVVAFGAGKTDVDESNAAQLWSTVYLAVRPPASSTRRPGSR